MHEHLRIRRFLVIHNVRVTLFMLMIYSDVIFGPKYWSQNNDVTNKTTKSFK